MFRARTCSWAQITTPRLLCRKGMAPGYAITPAAKNEGEKKRRRRRFRRRSKDRLARSVHEGKSSFSCIVSFCSQIVIVYTRAHAHCRFETCFPFLRPVDSVDFEAAAGAKPKMRPVFCSALVSVFCGRFGQGWFFLRLRPVLGPVVPWFPNPWSSGPFVPGPWSLVPW